MSLTILHIHSFSSFNHTESITLPRPTEMQQRGNSNLVEDVGEETNPRISILSFPDPENVYDTTLGAADVSNSYVYIPNIRNGEGDVITPDEYDTKLHDGTIVMVNVSLKLYVPLHILSLSYRHSFFLQLDLTTNEPRKIILQTQRR